jgi:hypothetical protein
MSVEHRGGFPSVALVILVVAFSSAPAWSQASYTAQVRGTVTDQSGAVVPGAKVTLTNDGTNISTTATTDGHGQYVFNGIRPAVYTLKVESAGFQESVQKNVVLAVAQQASLDLVLRPIGASITMTVTDTAPLLDLTGASLGTEVTNEFVSRMPLADRQVVNLVYLSAGVTELNNGIQPPYPAGTNFSSNGQRYGSAEFRLDGALATGPEQGEGATSNLSYIPSAEVIQEFKVQNNSFSAEYGSNGGTVVNVLMKSGTNKFHGSGWWFGRRTALNANDFFSNRSGVPRADSTRDQYGFSLLGPIVKDKTFFLFDLERERQNDKGVISGRVPMDLERTGDFSQTLVQDDSGNLVPVQIFDPFSITARGQTRSQYAGNVIPAFGTPGSPITAVGQALANAYPEPTGPVDPSSGNNFTKGVVNQQPYTQFDAKVDHQLNLKTRFSARYSQQNATTTFPDFFFGDTYGNATTRNVALEHTWTVTPHFLLTNRFGLDRYYQIVTPKRVDPTTFGLPALLTQANHLTRMPVVNVENYQTLNSQCCSDTKNGHTQYVFSSSADWVHGKHVVKFGGEGRQFFNNFFQPDYATGIFNFSKLTTASNPDGGNPSEQGTGLASLLLGFPGDGQLNIKTAVANKSKETAFFVQDDWKVTQRLTLNLGLRYDWSTPYTERHNRIEYSDFNALSGITVDLTTPTVAGDGSTIVDDQGNPVNVTNLTALGFGPTNLKGITRFPTASTRHVPVDRNNFGPRIGFAFQLMPNTVLRGGFGIFYGFSSTTNFQYAGTAFRRDAPIHFSNDGGITQYATLTNLFPNLPAGELPHAQGTQYGPLAEWGFVNQNDLGTTTSINPEVYQWNFGLQHLFPAGMVISMDYSANRSTHLPWGGFTRNRNVISTAARLACDTACQNTPVANPFQSLFTGPNAIFNEPDSRYSDPTIPLVNLLRPYPQFDNNFEGLPLLTASSWYNAMLVRFQKRQSHGLSFEGSYTWAKATDNSSYGANSFIFFGGSGLGFPQDLNNLKAEHSVGANDTRHRFEIAVVYDLPIGHGRWLGGGMNRELDGIVGGWSLNTLLTLQSGQPVPFALASPQLTDGNQRPNILCNPASGLSLHRVLFSTDPNASYFNANCLSAPPDQVAGNAPRFSGGVLGQGERNIDLGIFKSFQIRESKKVEIRAEFLNATNTAHFGTPSSYLGDSAFGKVTSQTNSPRRIQMGARFEF